MEAGTQPVLGSDAALQPGGAANSSRATASQPRSRAAAQPRSRAAAQPRSRAASLGLIARSAGASQPAGPQARQPARMASCTTCSTMRTARPCCCAAISRLNLQGLTAADCKRRRARCRPLEARARRLARRAPPTTNTTRPTMSVISTVDGPAAAGAEGGEGSSARRLARGARRRRRGLALSCSLCCCETITRARRAPPRHRAINQAAGRAMGLGGYSAPVALTEYSQRRLASALSPTKREVPMERSQGELGMRAIGT